VELAAVESRARWEWATPMAPTKRRWKACAVTLDTIAMEGTIVIGEGERDEAPMLFIGEKVGAARDKEGAMRVTSPSIRWRAPTCAHPAPAGL